MNTIKERLLFGMGLALAALLTIDLVSRYTDHPAPAPDVVDGAALGRAYAPTVVSTLADAWLVAADTLAAGKSVGEARASLHANWDAARAKAFVASVAPGFNQVLAEGTEPKDDGRRARVVALWRAFARGLKGGR